MRNVTHALVAAAAVIVTAACTVQHTSVPTVSGPSELSTSLRLTAAPDTVPQDGVAQSVVGIQAFDATGQPKSGLALRMSVNGLGSVSPGTVTTGSDGKATAVFTAPAPGATTTTISVVATPAGSDAATATPFEVNIRLTQVGAIPPVPTVPSTTPPTVEFVFSPTQPVVGQSISFNATQTVASVGHYITLYNWDFGDGSPQDSTTGQFPFHTYSIAGTYNVVLTATDDTGAKSTKVHGVTVSLGQPTVVLVLSKNGLTVTADATGSFAAPGASITTFTFIWNDGNTTVSTSGVATHTYAPPTFPATTETFNIVVRATDNSAVPRTGSATQSITLP